MNKTNVHLKKAWNRLPIWNSQNCSMFPLAFVAGWLQGHWWDFISRNYVVWPTFLLINVFIALKGSHFWFLFGSVATHKVHSKYSQTEWMPRLTWVFAGRIGHVALTCTLVAWSWLTLSSWTVLQACDRRMGSDHTALWIIPLGPLKKHWLLNYP